MVLIFRQVLIHVSLIVKYLYLHTMVCGIPFHRCPDAYAIIRTRCQPEFKSVNEIREFLLRIQVSAGPLGGLDSQRAFLTLTVRRRVACPFIQVGPVKQHYESSGLFFRASLKRLTPWKFSTIYVEIGRAHV